MINIDTSELESECVLQRTQKIYWKELDTPEQVALAKVYSDLKETGNTAAIYAASVINAILTQRRLRFCMTKRLTGEMIRKDKNHGCGFSDRYYSVLHNILVNDLKVLEVRQQGTGMMPTVYAVIHPDIRKMLIVDEAKQEKETIEFVNNRAGKTKAQVDVEIEKKKQAESEPEKKINGTANGTKTDRPKDRESERPPDRSRLEGNSKSSNSKKGKPKKENLPLVEQEYFPRLREIRNISGWAEKPDLFSEWVALKNEACSYSPDLWGHFDSWLKQFGESFWS